MENKVVERVIRIVLETGARNEGMTSDLSEIKRKNPEDLGIYKTGLDD